MTNASYGYLPGAMNMAPAFNDLSTPLVNIPKRDVPDFTHELPANPGRGAKEAAKVWQIAFDTYPGEAAAATAMEKLAKYRAECSKVDFNLDAVLDVAPSKFDAKLKEVIANRNNFPFKWGEVDAAMRRAETNKSQAIKSTGYFDHMIRQLDVKSSTKKFVDAVQELGLDAFDQGTASNTKPHVYATMIAEGKKLTILPHLMPSHLRGTKTIAALFTDASDLPVLTARETDPTRANVNFDDSEVLEHAKAKEGLRLASQLSTYLIALALNAYPGLTLNVATKWATIEDRQAEHESIGLAEVTMTDGTTQQLRVA